MAATPLAAFTPATYTCGQYADAKADAPVPADFASLWAFAFIQGYKNVGQPEMVITPDNRAALTAVIAKSCAANRDLSFLDLTAELAGKVKLK